MIQIPCRAGCSPQSAAIARLAASGDQAGNPWNPGPLVSCVTSLPSAFITWIWTGASTSVRSVEGDPLSVRRPIGQLGEKTLGFEVSCWTSPPLGLAVKISTLSVSSMKASKAIRPSVPGKVAEAVCAPSAITPAAATPITIADRGAMSSSLPWAAAGSTAYPCTSTGGRVHRMGAQHFCAARWHSERGADSKKRGAGDSQTLEPYSRCPAATSTCRLIQANRACATTSRTSTSLTVTSSGSERRNSLAHGLGGVLRFEDDHRQSRVVLSRPVPSYEPWGLRHRGHHLLAQLARRPPDR